MLDAPNKRQRFFKNSLFGLLSWLLPIIPTLIATPIVLEKIGKVEYGVLVVIIGFISYFFTTAIGKVAAKYVAEYRATGETEKISSVISATIILGVSITLIGILATVILARYIVVEVLQIPAELHEDAVTGLYLACATILSIVVGQVFQFVLQGLNRFDKYLLLANISSVSFSLGSIAIVQLGYGTVALLAWNLITWLIVCVLSYVSAKRLLTEMRFSFRIPREIWRIVAAYAVSIIAFQIFGNVLLIFERGWLLRHFGGEAVTNYTLPMALAMYLHLFTASLVLAMFPAINELLNQPEKLRELYQKTTKLVLTLLAFAVLSMIVCGKLFLGLWLKDNFAEPSYLLLVIHTITFAILALNTIAWQVADSFRAAFLNAIATGMWMAIGIGLMIILSNSWQSNGVAVARLAGVLVFIPLIFYIEKRFIGGIFWRFWASVTSRIVFATIPATLAQWALVSILGNSWLTFIAAVIAGFLVYFGTLLFVGFVDESEKQMLRDAFAKYR